MPRAKPLKEHGDYLLVEGNDEDETTSIVAHGFSRSSMEADAERLNDGTIKILYLYRLVGTYKHESADPPPFTFSPVSQ